MHWDKYTPKEKLHKKYISQLESYLTSHLGNNREKAWAGISLAFFFQHSYPETFCWS